MGAKCSRSRRENAHARRLIHRQSLRHCDVDSEQHATIAGPVVGFVPRSFVAVKPVVSQTIPSTWFFMNALAPIKFYVRRELLRETQRTDLAQTGTPIAFREIAKLPHRK